MAVKKEEMDMSCQKPPIIVSEVKLDFNEIIAMNRNIVNQILEADIDIVSKAGILERLLPGLAAAGDCACSCSCSCSCSCTCGSEALQGSMAPQSGRVV